jgi:glutamate--cysteine ligase
VNVPADPTEGPNLNREDLARFFEKAERPADRPEVIGTEQELFGVELTATGAEPIRYSDHVAPMLRGLVDQFGWEPGPDRGTGGEIIALERDGAAITLEPGGQIELSGAPLATLQETCAESTRHHRELQAVAAPLNVAFIATGFHPFATREEIDWMPKDRYRVMRAYLPTRGSRALDMMLRTCTVQANLDYANERECGQRFRLALALSAPVTAMFANSPFIEGRRSGFQSSRSDTWIDVDPDRCGIPAFAFAGEFSYESYVDWALKVPMFFIKRGGRYVACHRPFSEFLDRGFRDEDGVLHRASWADWELHLSTLFPEVRLKPFVEVRGGDAVAPAMVCAMPAVWKGLLYDIDAGNEAWELVSQWSHAERLELWKEARTQALHSDRVWTLSKKLVHLAREGLERIRAATPGAGDETHFLEPLEKLVMARTTLADLALSAVGDHAGRGAAGRTALVEHFRVAGARPV